MDVRSGSAEQDFDFSRQPAPTRTDSGSSGQNNGVQENGDDGEIPKNKRIACVICRKRKLKCDGNRPKCATCARLKHNCSYDEVRRKSGPKRGYVKELEARLAQVEAQVKTKESPSSKSDLLEQDAPAISHPGLPQTIPEAMEPFGMQNGAQFSMPESNLDPMVSNDPFSLSATNLGTEMTTDMLNVSDQNLGISDNFSWEMIALGLEEPMPTQEAIDELTHIYFEKFHPSVPVVHKYRYHTALTLAPQSRPPICLRYAMWCHAASITDKYMHHQDIFYRRARKYIDLDEMRGAGESFVSVAHAQTWTLLCAYEFKMMYFPRAWMSGGRSGRLAFMLGLNRVDGVGIDVKQCLPPAQDWTEREERRRTFWMAYCCDRYASIGTGWPMSIDERDIKSNLPASEKAYESGIPEKTSPLNEAMTHEQVAHLSSFAGVVYVTHFFGLNLTHLHRPESNDGEDDIQGAFWKRHRSMDNILLSTSLSLPSHLRLPSGVRNANIVFLNFMLHAATICLHQAAIFKAEKNQLPRSIIDQSRSRCIMAAGEIASVMRMTSHLDAAGMNPFTAFCLYVAARVFVQYLKKTPNDQDTRTSLENLLTAMSALKRKTPLTESFMVQLNLDIEGTGLDILLHNPDFSTSQTIANLEPCVRERVTQNIEAPTPAYCSLSPNLHETSSSSGRSPEEGKAAERPPDTTIRSESPRQTQYALRNIELQARESRKLPTYYSVSQVQGARPSNGWTRQYTNDGPNGLNPILNNNININAFDIDMTDTTHQSHSTSAGLTPQSSTTYRSTSNTSYSPPQVEEEVVNTANNFTSPNENLFASPNMVNAKSPNGMTSNPQDTSPFRVSGGWGVGDGDGGGTTPGMTPGFSGLTPDAGWEKMMQETGMAWSEQSTGMTPR